ncbi:MAG TPA: hypothetical protein VEC16_04220 [Alphaproteobacteria bacterium]|nr:hypothetical protein [Alphaproteobacteria bacterium]
MEFKEYDNGMRDFIKHHDFKPSILQENKDKYTYLKTVFEHAKKNENYRDMIIIYHDNDGTFKSMMDLSDNWETHVNKTFVRGRINSINTEYLTLNDHPQIWQLENIVDAFVAPIMILNGEGVHNFEFYSKNINGNDYFLRPISDGNAATTYKISDEKRPMILGSMTPTTWSDHLEKK